MRSCWRQRLSKAVRVVASLRRPPAPLWINKYIFPVIIMFLTSSQWQRASINFARTSFVKCNTFICSGQQSIFHKSMLCILSLAHNLSGCGTADKRNLFPWSPSRLRLISKVHCIPNAPQQPTTKKNGTLTFIFFSDYLVAWNLRKLFTVPLKCEFLLDVHLQHKANQTLIAAPWRKTSTMWQIRTMATTSKWKNSKAPAIADCPLRMQ